MQLDFTRSSVQVGLCLTNFSLKNGVAVNVTSSIDTAAYKTESGIESVDVASDDGGMVLMGRNVLVPRCGVAVGVAGANCSGLGDVHVIEGDACG